MEITARAILAETLRHLELTGLAMVLAVLVGVPLGLHAARERALEGPVLAVVNAVQTIPSLALLGFLIPLFGIGARPALFALFLYALLPIVRNTVAGVRAVDPAVIEAARGMGMRPRQILRRVELPLAMRTIMAGVRTSTVISIGVATLAAFIGAGGLGEPIVEGLYLNDAGLILLGAVPAAMLAIVADLGLGRIERALHTGSRRATATS